jgi:hypothetical protein
MSRRIHFRATFQRLLLLVPALVLGAAASCAPPDAAPLPDADRGRSPLDACGGRIRLPVEGINGKPGPTPAFHGVFSGEHDERVPVAVPSGDIVSVKEDGSVERRGQIVHATAGETFAFQIQSPLYEKDPPSIAVWGPIAECAADKAAELTGEPLGGTGASPRIP